jgi:hypothetical protein
MTTKELVCEIREMEMMTRCGEAWQELVLSNDEAVALIEAHDAEILREAADRAQAKLEWHRAHGNSIESLCIKDAITRGEI